MKKFRTFLVFILSLVLTGIVFNSCKQKKEDAGSDQLTQAETEEGINQLTQAEIDEGWILLFDGETTDGWKGYGQDAFPDSGWIVEDGTLHCLESGQGEAGGAGGDIIYNKKFSNFHLKMEWKISKGGNSGIFYLGQEIEGEPIWKTAPEMQVLDNERHPDAQLGKEGNRKAGSLYDLISADPQNADTALAWNAVEIMVWDGTVVHKMNGETVLEYHLWTDDWNDLVADSKFPELNPDWANVAKEGYIGFQDHGDAVWFRNIKIKEL